MKKDIIIRMRNFKYLLRNNIWGRVIGLFRKSNYKLKKVEFYGCGSIDKTIHGENNTISCGEYTTFEKTNIYIKGNNNHIKIGSGCRIRGTSFRIIGDNLMITIGNGLTSNHSIEYNANGGSITIGNDCMFSNNIIVRTSDDHPIIDTTTGKVTNIPSNVNIGDHVWLAPSCRIMKGVTIFSGSVVGTFSVVTHDVKANSIVAGIPARLIKENIMWDRSFKTYL